MKTLFTVAISFFAFFLFAEENILIIPPVSYLPEKIFFIGDNECGISSSKTYTHKMDFGNRSATSVNGVQFEKVSAASGYLADGIYGWSGSPSSTAAGNENQMASPQGDDVYTLLTDLCYNNSSGTFILNGLDPDKEYRFRMYFRSWGKEYNRSNRLTFFPGTAAESCMDFNPDAFASANNSDQIIQIQYIPLSNGTFEMAYQTLNPECTIHFYAVTNEEVPEDEHGGDESGLVVKSFSVSGITARQAVFSGGISKGAENGMLAFLYLDTEDRGMKKSAWETEISLGTVSNGWSFSNMNKLFPNTEYAARLCISSGDTNYWTAPLEFKTKANDAVYTWIRDAGEWSWSETANWSPSGIPNGIGDVARFVRGTGAQITNRLDLLYATLGTLVVGGDNQWAGPYIMGPYSIVQGIEGACLLFDNFGEEALIATDAAYPGAEVSIEVPIFFVDELRVDNVKGTPLTFTETFKAVGDSTPHTLSFAGAGTIDVGRIKDGLSADETPMPVSVRKEGTHALKITGLADFTGSLDILGGIIESDASIAGTLSGAESITINMQSIMSGTEKGISLFNSVENGTAVVNLPETALTGSYSSGLLGFDNMDGESLSVYINGLYRNSGAFFKIVPTADDTLGAEERLFIGNYSSGTGWMNPWCAISGNGGDFAWIAADGEIVRPGSYGTVNWATGQTTDTYVETYEGIVYTSTVLDALKLSGGTLTLAADIILGSEGDAGLILGDETKVAGAGSLISGTNTVSIFVDSNSSATLSAPLNGTGAYHKFGSGKLQLENINISGKTFWMADGTLSMTFTDDNTTENATFKGSGLWYLDNTPQITSFTLADGKIEAGEIFLHNGTARFSESDIENYGRLTLAPDGETNSDRRNAGHLVIEDGTKWKQIGDSTILIGDSSRRGDCQAWSNSVTVAGTGSESTFEEQTVFDAGGNEIIIGRHAGGWQTVRDNKMDIFAGGIVTNAGYVSLAYAQGGDQGELNILSGGCLYSAGGQIGGGLKSSGGGSANKTVVDGEGSVWHVGGALNIGSTSGGNKACSNELHIVDGGAVIGVTSLGVGDKLGNSGAQNDSNMLIIESGSILETNGDITIGAGYGAASSNNVAIVNSGSWNSSDGILRISYGKQGSAFNNVLVLTNGAEMTHAGAVYVGQGWAKEGSDAKISVTDGSCLKTAGQIRIGYGHGPSQPNPSNRNRVFIGGGVLGDSEWDAGNDKINIGYSSSTEKTDVAHSNSLVAASGGSVINAGEVIVGNRVGNTVGNNICFAGGTVDANSLTIGESNLLTVAVTRPWPNPAMTVAGNATFQENTWVFPEDTDDSMAGIYPLVVADSITGAENLMLADTVDDSIWRLSVTDTTVTLFRMPRAAIMIVR